MPTETIQWLELPLIVLTIAGFLLSLTCLIYRAVGWHWRVIAGCGALACLSGLISYDLWRNSIDQFPDGALPRGRLLYLALPAVAVGCIVRGLVAGVLARGKATASEPTSQLAAPERRSIFPLVYVVSAIAAAIVGMGLVTVWDSFVLPAPAILQGTKAPDFVTGTWINSEHPIDLPGLKGKVAFVQFSFINCLYCRRMTPHLVNWHERFSPDGLVVLEIDNGDIDSLDAVRQWVAKDQIPFPVLHDTNGATCAKYDIRAYPSMYLVGPSGVVVWEGRGMANDTPEAIEAAIRKELGALGK